jgi:O-antigen/teichoic acid export membrane protein
VHSLGHVAYGIWALTQSMVAYLSLLDLGIRSALTRFVTREREHENHLECSRIVSGALWLRLGTGVVIMAISIVLSNIETHLFAIPHEIEFAAKWTTVIVGLTLCTNLAFGVFGGVLASLHRFDLLAMVTIVQTAVRALGAFWLLRNGYGIVALAVWELSVGSISGAILALFCFREYPELRVLSTLPSRTALKEIWSYSVYAFMINIFVQIIYYTDNLLVGAFLSLEAVTFYVIAGGLVEQLRQVVSSMTMTFTPMASTFDANGKTAELKQLLTKGTNAALLVALPIAVALFFRGQTFIGLWMGDQYAAVSGNVLRILLIAHVFALANFTSGSIAYGLGKHRPIALWAAAEAAANVGLSVLLLGWLGLNGVAWGTVIPSLAVHLIFWPRYICGLVGVPVSRYLWGAWARPAIAVTPFAIACYITDQIWSPVGLFQFFCQIALILPIFLLTVAVCFWSDVSSRLSTSARNTIFVRNG